MSYSKHINTLLYSSHGGPSAILENKNNKNENYLYLDDKIEKKITIKDI